MNKQQLTYIVDTVLKWNHPRSTAVMEYFRHGQSCRQLQIKYCPTHQFTVSRDVITVNKIYAQAHNIINAKLL